jgi:hypothetical protein
MLNYTTCQMNTPPVSKLSPIMNPQNSTMPKEKRSHPQHLHFHSTEYHFVLDLVSFHPISATSKCSKSSNLPGASIEEALLGRTKSLSVRLKGEVALLGSGVDTREASPTHESVGDGRLGALGWGRSCGRGEAEESVDTRINCVLRMPGMVWRR